MPGTIVVARPDPPDAQPPPRGRFIAGALAVAALGLLAFGWIADSPAVDQVDPNAAAIEAPPLPATAATTLPPLTTATPAPGPEGPVAATLVSRDELARPGLAFQEVPPPEGMDVITHVLGVEPGIAAFGRPEVAGPRTGLQLGRWNGAWWSEPVVVLPDGEFAIDVAGGKAGFAVISAVGGPLGVFPGGLAPDTYRLRVSDDGVQWREVPLPPMVYPQALIVDAGGAWLLGFEQSEQDRAIAAAMTDEMRRLYQSGRVFVVPLGSGEVSVHAPALGTRVGSVELTGIDSLGGLRPFVAFRSSDLRDWEQVPAPQIGSWIAAAGLDAHGVAYLVSPFGIWRNPAGVDWEQAVSFPAGTGVGAIATTDDSFLVVNPFTAVAEIRRFGLAGDVARFRFPLPGQQLSTSTAGNGASGMFATGAPLALEDEPGYLDLADGRRLVIDLGELEYRVVDAGQNVVAVSSIVDTADNRGFDAETGTVTFLDDAGTVAATVELSELSAWGSTNLRYRPLHSGGVLYTLGDEWRYQPLAELLAEEPEVPVGVSAISAIGSTFVVATGPIDPWVSNRAPSHIWIASPPTHSTVSR